MLIPAAALAEGSKEVNANGGNRAFLVSGTRVSESFTFPTNGTMKVFVKAGEVINVGSSVQGNGLGTINLRSPNGATFSSGTSTTVGLIADRGQELAGALPNTNGYTPYKHTVTAAEAGVWEIDFISQNGGAQSANPTPIAANADWTQPNGQVIAAFDISVRNAGNTAFLTGRVFTNIFSGILGSFDVGFNGIFQVLTRDGYQYTLDNNGQAGNGFSFFVNNKGFRLADGTASYKSINSLANPDVHDPRLPDTQSDITYKIFFNQPAADLPASANSPSGTTWLLNAVVEPTLTNYGIAGKEGASGRAGTFPIGATMTFNANKNGNFQISIDINRNGIFTDAIDRKLTGSVVAGPNNIIWDGLDGQGNPATAGSYNTNLNVVLFGGEVHFPFFDVERNINGLKLTRANGFQSPDYTVYWDDSQIVQSGTASSPRVNTTGGDSRTNGHKWGTPGGSPVDFGDQRGLDTWAYIAATPLVATSSFQLLQADLEVTGITSTGVSGSCSGQTITYTIPVKNNGPSNVTGSKFSFSFPAALTEVRVTHAGTTGTSSVNNGVTTNNNYSAMLDLANGAIRTFTVTGKVAASTAGAVVNVTASILRPADVTDPDATNPDNTTPTDPLVECNSEPSGAGCNNIKTNSLSFIGTPDITGTRTVVIDEVVTLTDTNPGTWSQSGSTPAVLSIANSAGLSTTVSGFKTPGVYHVLRTNVAGCSADIAITVIPQTLNIPNIITPNGDGLNDTFIVPDIQLFPGSLLIIVNRLGNEVYRNANYLNTWSGDGLPEGTYYYVLTKKDPISGALATFKGWVFLKR
ncbi:hypothetical protein GCM10028827_13620 [Mucilaginibacter myungsuensis]